VPGAQTIDPAWAREQLWRRGRLRWKLYPDQREVYEFMRGNPARTVVVNVARQFGKSFIVLLYAVEFALQNPGVQVRFVSSNQKSLRKIVHPNMRAILRDCPADMRPQWKGEDGYYFFPSSGSELHMAGANDGHEDDSRGQRSHLNVVDEAGFVDRLEYLVKSVLLPQTKTTRGRTILISTPPETPAHDYVGFVVRAESRDAYIVRTIDDDKHTPEVEKREMIEELGGMGSTAVLRECYCQFVVEETKAVVPEFVRDGRSERIVQPVPPPTYEFPIVAMDVGFEDFHAVLYGYWHFRSARLVIQAEDVLARATTDRIAQTIKAREADLWAGKLKTDRPVRRWSDTDLRLIADLSELHKLAVLPTAKDDKEAQVNALRMLVKDEKIAIDPSCRTLIRQLKTAVWKDNRKEFERTKTEGHFDCVDALIYMLRNAPRYENPYPSLPDGLTDEGHWIPAHLRNQVSPNAQAVGSLFKRRG
jgi:hypothetical protein